MIWRATPDWSRGGGCVLFWTSTPRPRGPHGVRRWRAPSRAHRRDPTRPTGADRRCDRGAGVGHRIGGAIARLADAVRRADADAPSPPSNREPPRSLVRSHGMTGSVDPLRERAVAAGVRASPRDIGDIAAAVADPTRTATSCPPHGAAAPSGERAGGGWLAGRGAVPRPWYPGRPALVGATITPAPVQRRHRRVRRPSRRLAGVAFGRGGRPPAARQPARSRSLTPVTPDHARAQGSQFARRPRAAAPGSASSPASCLHGADPRRDEQLIDGSER